MLTINLINASQDFTPNQTLTPKSSIIFIANAQNNRRHFTRLSVLLRKSQAFDNTFNQRPTPRQLDFPADITLVQTQSKINSVHLTIMDKASLWRPKAAITGRFSRAICYANTPGSLHHDIHASQNARHIAACSHSAAVSPASNASHQF